MPDLQIIFDREQQLAAVVNVDTLTVMPIAAAGPRADDILRGFVDAMPFDVTLLPAETLFEVYGGWLQSAGFLEPGAAETGAEDEPQPPDGAGADAAALATREASETAGEPPEPAPADADLDAAESPSTAVVRCWNCNGEGVIHFGDGAPDQSCNMCSGSGRVTMSVAT